MSMYSSATAEQLAALDTDNILMAWQEADEQLRAAKTREMQLRMLAFSKAIPQPVEGVNNIPLGNGWLLKATHKMNYKVAKGPELGRVLAHELFSDISERLVKWEPELSISTFKSLDKRQSKLFAPLVTIKPGAPSLLLLPPGAEGNKRV